MLVEVWNECLVLNYLGGLVFCCAGVELFLMFGLVLEACNHFAGSEHFLRR